VREESLQVRVDEKFEVSLCYQAGTGTTWIAKDLAGVTLLSQSTTTGPTIPGGPRQQVFTLLAKEPGEFTLIWNLIRDPRTVYETYRLRLHVKSR